MVRDRDVGRSGPVLLMWLAVVQLQETIAALETRKNGKSATLTIAGEAMATTLNEKLSAVLRVRSPEEKKRIAALAQGSEEEEKKFDQRFERVEGIMKSGVRGTPPRKGSRWFPGQLPRCPTTSTENKGRREMRSVVQPWKLYKSCGMRAGDVPLSHRLSAGTPRWRRAARSPGPLPPGSENSHGTEDDHGAEGGHRH